MRFPKIQLTGREKEALEAPDLKTALEQETLKSEKLQTKLKQTELWSGWSNLGSRFAFSISVFCLIVWWLGFVKGVITDVAYNRAHLTDAVLIALITTTTANVLGLWVIVANYLYQKGKMAEAVKNEAKADSEPSQAN